MTPAAPTADRDSVPTPQPVAERDRLAVIDVARGLALLGILLVNVHSFGQPFGRFMVPRPESSDLTTQVWFYLMRVLCEGKFYPLFSLLFGMGLVLQMGSVERARATAQEQGKRTRSFGGLYARRLLVLLCIGLVHATVLWYGDILFVYALAGFVLLACSRLSGRALVIAGAVVMLIATGLGGLLGGMTQLGQQQQQAAARSPQSPAAAATDGAPAAEPPDAATPRTKSPDELDQLAERSAFFQLMKGFKDNTVQGGPEHPRWISLEAKAYREGPWLDTMLFRGMTWLMYLVVSVLGFGWSIIAMFLLGAGLLKLGLFTPERRKVRRGLMLLGVFVGLPGSIASVWLAAPNGGFFAGAASLGLTFFCGPLMSLMYLSFVAMVVESGVAARITRVLAAVGRMALTNYLTHTLVCTWVFYYWGLAQFDLWTRGERSMLAVGVFAVQCALSPLWLSRFRFGPMEWVWRSLTYGAAQPMRRSA